MAEILVATNDPVIAENLNLLRQYGWRERYVSEVAGWNTRLDELQAAILRVKLCHLSVLVASPGAGVVRVTPDLRSEPVFATDAAIEDLLRDRAGRLWMATGQGVFRVDGASVTRFGREEGLARDDAEVLLEGADGAIWVGGREGVGRIDGDRAVSWTTASGLPSDRVRALHEDERGSLWIGTYDGGLVRRRDGRFAAIRARDGLHDDGVFAIVDDGRGRFWMSSNRGIHVAEYLDGLKNIPGLKDAVKSLVNVECHAESASAIEFIREGLHLSNKLNKETLNGKFVYK